MVESNSDVFPVMAVGFSEETATVAKAVDDALAVSLMKPEVDV